MGACPTPEHPSEFSQGGSVNLLGKKQFKHFLQDKATAQENLEGDGYHVIGRIYLKGSGDLIVDEKGFEYKAYGVYVVADEQIQFPASSLVRLTGKPLPDPKTQKTTLLVTQVEFPENVEGYDSEALRRLAEVFEGKSCVRLKSKQTQLVVGHDDP